MTVTNIIDIEENELRNKDNLLGILLTDFSTNSTIIWATDSYLKHGKHFSPKQKIQIKLVTGIYGKTIRPRASKSLREQKKRTKEKAEVFTPLDVVSKMNSGIDELKYKKIDNSNWKKYIQELKLEITCGEAPFIVTRYDPTSNHGELIRIKDRVGFLDKKLQVVSKFCKNKKDWIKWAKKAFMSSYGYEWQGDNLLIARENMLYTFTDYYKDKFNEEPNIKLQHEMALIIAWNVFQMDGIKYVIPMSCFEDKIIKPPNMRMFGVEEDEIEKNIPCEGCKTGNPFKHTGIYAKTMDWETNKATRFVDLLK